MAKQLFNTTEKSNFILNMTEEKFSKLASMGLLSSFLLTSLFTAIPLFSGSKAYTISSIGLTISGVICMVLALIGIIKKYINKKVVVPAAAIGFMLVWAIISMFNSYDIYVSINGFPGRGEGILALLFYAGFFITAASIKTDKARKTLLCGILVNGVLNSLLGLVQIFTGSFSEFSKVSLKTTINAASGFSASPLFLAMVLSVSIAVAISGLVLFEGKKAKILCVISVCLFSFVNMFTYSLIGICGTALAAVMGAIMIIAAKAPKINLLSVLAVFIPAAAAVVIVNSGAIGNIDSYRLYDGRILWFADSYMRVNSSGDFDADIIDIDDTADVYYTLNRKTMDIISAYGLVGTGPDQLLYPQLYTFGTADPETLSVEDVALINKGTFDRVYNEYLNTAATRGIPSAIALAVTLLGILAAGIKGYKRSRSNITLCMLLLTIMGVLLFFICCSSTAFTPIFWAVAGCSVVNFNAPDEKKSGKVKKSK